MFVIIYALIGVLAGFLSGLLGIGGGLITVPCLVLSFYFQEFPKTHSMQLAIGTSLATMVFTTASSAYAHHLHKGVCWSLFLSLAPGIIVGAITGAMIANWVPSRVLELFFGFFECIVGIYFFFFPPGKELKGTSFEAPHISLMALIGVLIGAFSTVFGSGGGIITVPILMLLKTPMRNAISTSAVTGFLITTIGAIAFLYLGMQHPSYHESVGYIYLPAFIMISVISTLLAPYGARHTYTLPIADLRRLFGIILIAAGGSLIYV